MAAPNKRPALDSKPKISCRNDQFALGGRLEINRSERQGYR
jgi:hypothetical protein